MYTSMFRKAMLGDTATLNLDFTTGTLDSRLTFTRASTATYINSSGYVATATTNEPRFDYSPTNIGQPRGLLIEGSAINLINWSESFQTTGGAFNWNWSVLNVTRGTVTTTAPTGSSATVVKIEETNANGVHAPLTLPNANASTEYTFSVYAKAAERTFVQLLENGGSSGSCMVNLSTGAIVSEFVAGSATVTPYGTSGWYRISLKFTLAVSQTAANCQIRLSTDGTTTSYTGTTGSGIYIWGAQLELGSGASSYISTGASQVTRNAEECRMTGTNFSSWFAGATEGVFFAEYEKPRKLGSQDYVALSTVYAAGALLNITTNTGTLYPASICWPTGGALFPGGITTACPADTKRAIRWFNGNDFSNFADGVLGTTSNGTGTLTMTMLNVGATTNTGTSSTADWLNSCIKKIKFYPTALPNADIQTLTAP